MGGADLGGLRSGSVSSLFVDLVFGLAPLREVTRAAASPVALRDKFVLLVLASQADDLGRCTISIARLTVLMECGDPELVRSSLRVLEEYGLILITRQASGPNRYWLQRDALEQRQLDHLLRAGVSADARVGAFLDADLDQSTAGCVGGR